MALLEKNLLVLSQMLLAKAYQDGIERILVKLVIKNDNKVLILKRTKTESMPNLYELPGGGLDKGEDVFSAGRRELYEETGLFIQDFLSSPEILDVVTRSSNQKCRVCILDILPKEGNIVLSPKEHIEYKWVSVAEIDELFMFPEIKTLLKKILLSN